MLIKHSILYTIAKFLPGLLSITATGILTHLFDPTQYGVYALVILVMTFTANIGFDWLGVSFLRFYDSTKGDPRTIATYFHIFSVLMVVSAIVGFPVWFVGSDYRISAAVCALGIVLAWIYSSFEMISKIEVANFRPFRYLTMNLTRGALMLVGAVGLGWLSNDPLWAAVGTGIGMLMSIASGTKQISRLGIRYFNRDLAARIFRFGVPLAISMTLAGLINSATRLLVETLDSREALGLYTAAFVIVQNSITVLAAGISSVSYQLAVRAVDSGDADAERSQILNNGTLLLAVLAPTSLGMILTSQDIAVTLVGPKFQTTVTLLTPWLATAGFFASLRAYFFDYSFQLGDRFNAQAWITAVAAGIAIALSIYLIPQYGPLGAAIAVTVSMFFSCCLAAVVGYRIYYIPFPFKSAFLVLGCCVIMSGFVIAVPGTGPVLLVWKIAVGSVAYAAAAISLNLLGLRDHLWSYLLRRS